MVVTALTRVRWEPSWRIIPTRYPKIDLFEDVADPGEMESVLALYAIGNDRLREQLGLLRRIPLEDRIAGPGTSFIMAAFTHLNPTGSRFSDGSYGVFYAARTVDVAIAETQHHLARFYAATNQGATDVDQRLLSVDLRGTLHDIRGRASELRRVYSKTSYSASQRFGREKRSGGSWGIAYDCVRTKGQCAAVFRPPALSNCREKSWLSYAWDGRRFVDTYEKRPFAV